jgi:hypothetical protein
MFCAVGLIFDGTEGVRSLFHVLRSRTHFRRCRVRRVPFSCFALSDSFLTVPRTLGPYFKYCSPGLIFDGTEGVGSLFHVLRSRTPFRRYRGLRIPFSCCAFPNSFSAVSRASGLFFMLNARTHFQRYGGCRVPFSYFAVPDSFSAVPRASGPVVMFFAPRLIFFCTVGVGSSFHVLRSHTHFRRYRGRQVPFSCFALPESFSAVPRASGPVFMFCAPGLVFGGDECVGSRFQILPIRTHFRRYRGHRVPFSYFARSDSFRRYRGRRVPFSCFALPDSFSAVPRASGPVFMFCAPRLIFDGTEGVGSRIHVLRSQTHFQRYLGRRVPFSCFALPDSFSAVPRASGPIFMFCAPEIVFNVTEGVGSRFHVLCSRTRFRR